MSHSDVSYVTHLKYPKKLSRSFLGHRTAILKTVFTGMIERAVSLGQALHKFHVRCLVNISIHVYTDYEIGPACYRKVCQKFENSRT